MPSSPRIILLTGFEAFGDTPVNPAESVVRALDGTTIEPSVPGAASGAASEVVPGVVRGVVVPNTFFECIEVVAAAIAEHEPEVVVMMGEFGGRSMVTLERFGLNFNDSTRYDLLDNAGVSMQGEPTVPDGPTALRSTLPLRAMVRAMRDAGIPADISDAPGTFCCNHLLYGVLHHIESRRLPIRAGWIHLPALPEVAALPENLNTPSMSAATATAGVRIAIAAALGHPLDSAEPSRSRLQI